MPSAMSNTEIGIFSDITVNLCASATLLQFNNSELKQKEIEKGDIILKRANVSRGKKDWLIFVIK